LLDLLKKTAIINQHHLSDKDTGSADVQIAILTERINQLTRHMNANGHDFHTKRALLKIVGRRRRLLSYLNRTNIDRYKLLIKNLGLRK
jgi:small subunit ribosomal protein S15